MLKEYLRLKFPELKIEKAEITFQHFNMNPEEVVPLKLSVLLWLT